jgi:hypothetical protein
VKLTSEQIEAAILDFDAKKVATHMERVRWIWVFAGEGPRVPRVPEILDEARRLLRSLEWSGGAEGVSDIACGGLRASLMRDRNGEPCAARIGFEIADGRVWWKAARRARAKAGISAILLALASPLAAQEPEPPAPEPGLYAAALCTQREGEDDPSARCDLGVAVPLYHRVRPETRRGWAVVGFLGGGGAGEGEGLGIAGVGASWLFPVGERQGGLGVGWAIEWGGEGIDVADGRLTVGFTIGGRR